MRQRLKGARGALLFVAVAFLALEGCTASLGGYSPAAHENSSGGAHPLAHETLQRMQAVDPGIKRFLKSAYGYAVFPTVAKGGFVVGGAYGKGGLFLRSGSMVADCNLSQATVGLQLGGQTYSEVIFFRNKTYFDHFKAGRFAFDAQASAVAVTAGAAANAAYSHGTAVFSLPKAGLMYEASIGGQRFSCKSAKRNR